MPRPPWRAVPWIYRIRQWATKGGGVQRRSKPLPAGGITVDPERLAQLSHPASFSVSVLIGPDPIQWTVSLN
jgi:hypothetical protein